MLPWERIKLICDDAQLAIIMSDGSKSFAGNESIEHVIDIKELDWSESLKAESPLRSP